MTSGVWWSTSSGWGTVAETKDQVGGFAVVECDDLDEAIEIATGHPAVRFGQVEIRPVRDP